MHTVSEDFVLLSGDVSHDGALYRIPFCGCERDDVDDGLQRVGLNSHVELPSETHAKPSSWRLPKAIPAH
jgi:hypothetical protein